MSKSSKTRSSRLEYVSASHLIIPGFETPFDQNLDPSNRWVILANKIPWDRLVHLYNKQLGRSNFGASKINGRIAIGSLIIKFLNDLSDREVVTQLQENIYMQYFVGLSSFCNAPLFDPSLLVEFRHRLGMDELKEINEIIIANWAITKVEDRKDDNNKDDKNQLQSDESTEIEKEDELPLVVEQDNKGSLIMDATVAPQDIAYPTDLNLLSEAREILETLIDTLHKKSSVVKKPRTYRETAHKEYLKVAQNKNPSRKTIKKALKK